MTDENSAIAEKDEKAKSNTSAAESNDKKTDSSKDQKREGRSRRGGGKMRGKAREPKEFEESILRIARVTRVVKGGRRMRFQVSVVIGDKKGRVGFGIGKAAEVVVGIQKAVAAAKKNLFTVPIFEDSIPHDVVGRFKATKVMLFPAPEGTGVIAGGAVRKILELSGVKNMLSKSHGSRNAVNMAHATFDALSQLQKREPKKGKKEIDKSEEMDGENKKGDASEDQKTTTKETKSDVKKTTIAEKTEGKKEQVTETKDTDKKQ